MRQNDRRSILLPALLLCLSCHGPVPHVGNAAQDAQGDGTNELAFAGRVTDAANILTPHQRTVLTSALAAVERRAHAQMVIVTVPSLKGRAISTYARDLGNRWGIGRRGRDDGVLILLAPNDRQVRIAVGYGLEATLPEAPCQSVIDEQMLPAFRKGQFFEGLSAGVKALDTHL